MYTYTTKEKKKEVTDRVTRAIMKCTKYATWLNLFQATWGEVWDPLAVDP